MFKQWSVVGILGGVILAATGCSGAGAESGVTPTTEGDVVDRPADTDENLLLPAVTEEAALDGERRSVPGVNLGPLWTEYSLPSHGGNGGAFVGHVTNGVIYGVQINAGKYVDHIRFAYYLPSNPDNLYRSGDFVGNTTAFGGSGGVANPWIYCPAGQGVIGLRGAAGALVDRLGIICGNVTNPSPIDSGNWYSNVYGGGGGNWFSETCATGYLMNSANIRSGRFLDNIQGICIRAH